MRKAIFLILLIPALCWGQWAPPCGGSGNADTTAAIGWDETQTFEAGIAFDSTATGDLPHASYIDFTNADNASAAIYWMCASATDYWTTSGVFRTSSCGRLGGLIVGFGDKIYKSLNYNPLIYFSDFLGLDVGYNQGVGTIRIGDTETAGEFISVDSLGRASFPVTMQGANAFAALAESDTVEIDYNGLTNDIITITYTGAVGDSVKIPFVSVINDSQFVVYRQADGDANQAYNWIRRLVP